MNKSSITVQSLGKSFRIGQGQRRARYGMLRDKIVSLFSMPARWISHGSRGSGVETIWALKDVSFTIEQGDVVGVIGRNGAGKSTLLKILSRITEPTEGTADIYGRIGSLLEVGTGFHPELTGRENIFLNGAILGMKKTEISAKFDDIVDFSEVAKFIDTPVKHYSSGMYLRLAFAVAAHLNPEILLIDEVLAVGDAAFQKKCLGKMGEVSRLGRTVMFVSHNMDAILNLCPRCMVIDSGRLVFTGPSEDAVRFYLNICNRTDQKYAEHVLYQNENDISGKEPKITRIETLDISGSPKPLIYTWDDLVFRLHYESDADIHHGSLILDICDFKQQRLLVFESGTKIPIKKGCHYVDCSVSGWPLAAGEYYIGAGITVSENQWLWREHNIGLLNVHGKDVFELGRTPSSMIKGFHLRSFFAVPHKWSVG